MARAHLFRRLELLDVRVVVALDVLRRDGDARSQLIAIDQEVADLPLFAPAVLGLVRVVVRRDVRVIDRHLVAELVRGQRNDLQLHLLVAILVLALHVGIRHGHPVGDRRAQLVDHHAAPQVLFEVALGHRGLL